MKLETMLANAADTAMRMADRAKNGAHRLWWAAVGRYLYSAAAQEGCEDDPYEGTVNECDGRA